MCALHEHWVAVRDWQGPSRPRWEKLNVLYMQVICCLEDIRLLWYSELFVASLANYKNSLMREGQICPFTGQDYGCTPAADIQTIGKKAVEQKVAQLKQKKKWTLNSEHVSCNSLLSDVGPESQHINLHWHARMHVLKKRGPVWSCTSEPQFRAACVKDSTFHWNEQGQHQKRT